MKLRQVFALITAAALILGLTRGLWGSIHFWDGALDGMAAVVQIIPAVCVPGYEPSAFPYSDGGVYGLGLTLGALMGLLIVVILCVGVAVAVFLLFRYGLQDLRK